MPSEASAAKLAIGVATAAGLALLWVGSSSRLERRAAGPPGMGVENAPEPRSVASGPGARRSMRVAPMPPITSPFEGFPPAVETEAGETSVLPAGTLEVVVLRRRAPVRSGEVHLLASRGNNWIPRDPWSQEERPLTLPIGGDGIARGAALAPGEYHVWLALGGGAAAQRRVTLPEGEGQRIVLDFGDAELHGYVYDADGTAVSGARVQVDGMPGDHYSSVTWTGDDGHYRVSALNAGSRWVGVNHDGSSYTRGEHMLPVRFKAREIKRLDFGRPEGLATWRGTLRSRAGGPVSATPLGAATLHLVRAEDRCYSSAKVDSSGRFDLRLAPGHYRVSASPAGHPERLAILGALEVGGADFERDLTLPGTRLIGRVTRTGAEAGFDVAEGRSPLRVQMHLTNHNHPSAFHSAAIDVDGRFVFDGLSSGTWQIDYAIGQLPSPVEVVVGEDDVEIVIQVSTPW